MHKLLKLIKKLNRLNILPSSQDYGAILTVLIGGVHMAYRYNIHKGLERIKTKTFIAISTLGLILGSGGMSLAIFGTAGAISPVWNVTGTYQINVVYLGTPYAETLSLTQSGSNITGGTLNTIPPTPGSAFTITGGSVTGSNIDIYATQDTSTLVVHLFGTIAPSGTMNGNWNDVSPGTRIGTWETTSGAAFASKIKDFDADKNLNKSQCSVTKTSKEVVDVNYKLVNDYDSGFGGNAWANDTIHRQLNIWNTSGNNYCAIVKDDGNFVTMAGQSPNVTGSVGTGIKGDMDGGYRTISFQGTFIGNANYHTHGNLGTFDLQCTDAYTCPGVHPSLVSYFSEGSSLNWDYAWWGWEYNTCQNGNWVNSITDNVGDITGDAPAHNAKCHGDNDNHHHGNDGHYGHRDNGHYGDKDKHEGPRE